MRIHLIATGGAVMHNLAIALQSLGHEVSGSDDEIYNPARDRLATAGLLPEREGWFPEKIASNLDVVVLGMHARKDNPELLRAQELGLRILSYPELVYEMSKAKRRFVVAGSHGKTTTVAMIMHCLKKQKIDFDYVVGAGVEGFANSVQLSDAPYIIIEGDEYPASPTDPTPKMVHYRPHSVAVTGVAWDHFNIYPTFEKYCDAFAQLLDSLAPESNLIWYSPDPELKKMVAKRSAIARFFSVPYTAFPGVVENGQHFIKIWGKPRVPMMAFGQHNLANARAAMLICGEMGVSDDDFLRCLGSFKGASRRLNPIFENRANAVWEDFAHAPSKVKATIEAVKMLYPQRKLVACFELHTFSSLNAGFLPQYRDAMAGADHAIVFFDPHTLEMKKLPPLDTRQIREAFNLPELEVFTEIKSMTEALERMEWENANLLFMSSGKFGGLNLKKTAQSLLMR